MVGGNPFLDACGRGWFESFHYIQTVCPRPIQVTLIQASLHIIVFNNLASKKTANLKIDKLLSIFINILKYCTALLTCCFTAYLRNGKASQRQEQEGLVIHKTSAVSSEKIRIVWVRNETNTMRLRGEDVAVGELYSKCRSSRVHTPSHSNTKRENIWRQRKYKAVAFIARDNHSQEVDNAETDTTLKWVVIGRNKSTTTSVTLQSCPNQCLEISLATAGNMGKDKVHQILCLGWDGPVESGKCTFYADARNSSWPFLVTFSPSGSNRAGMVRTWRTEPERTAKVLPGALKYAGPGSFKEKQLAFRGSKPESPSSFWKHGCCFHLILRLLMIEILCQLVGIWQHARLSQISVQRLLWAGSSAKAISLLETSKEEPARGQTAGPPTKREVSRQQVECGAGCVRRACPRKCHRRCSGGSALAAAAEPGGGGFPRTPETNAPPLRREVLHRFSGAHIPHLVLLQLMGNWWPSPVCSDKS